MHFVELKVVSWKASPNSVIQLEKFPKLILIILFTILLLQFIRESRVEIKSD